MDNDNLETIFSHRVDKKDVIVKVSKNWRAFAQENYGASACFPEKIIGTPLWNHIGDPETKHLYEIILQKVRKNKRPAVFSFRCDSPEKRRFLKLEVLPRDDGSVDFISKITKTEFRPPVQLLRTDIERSDEFLRMCSMCKKIENFNTEWEEVEVAVQKMKLFEKDALPQLTHTLCEPCYDAAMAELDR